MKKLSKYKSVKTEFNGVLYDSRKEANRASVLHNCELHGGIKNLKRQVKYSWIEKHCLGDLEIEFKRSWIADFTYLNIKTGELIIEDVKGFRTVEYRKKKKIVEHLFGIKISEI